MKKRKVAALRMVACVFVMLTANVEAAPIWNVSQSTDSSVDIDLRKLQGPRRAKDLESLAKLIDEDSQKWKSIDNPSFLAYMEGALGELSSYDYPSVSKQAKLLTRYALEVLDSGRLSVEQKVRFLEYLSYDAPDWDEVTWRRLRFQKANLWLDAWKQIAATIDPTFDFSEVPMINIDPPAGSQVPSGSSPEALKDPKQRAEYVRSLAANDARTARITEQHFLRLNAGRFYEEAERYLVTAYSKSPPDSAELDRLLIEKGINPTIRARLLKQVDERS